MAMQHIAHLNCELLDMSHTLTTTQEGVCRPLWLYSLGPALPTAHIALPSCLVPCTLCLSLPPVPCPVPCTAPWPTSYTLLYALLFGIP